MPVEMIDIMTSLTAIMAEETERLRGLQRMSDLGELAAAKGRLVGRLEEVLARRNRQQPNWTDQLDEESREKLTQCLAELRDVSAINSEVLERQIQLSMDMMAAIANEARHLAGNRTYTYDAVGEVAKVDLATPISFNNFY